MKDIVGFLTTPSSLIILFWLIGMVALFIGRLRRLGMLLLVIGGVFYVILASGPVSSWLLGQLEHRYPALNHMDEVKNVETIVVLAGHAEPDSYLPISSVVSSSTAFRLMEAVRLWRVIEGSKILISGAGDAPELMKKVLISLGVPGQSIVLENKGRNTYESAVNVRQMVGAGGIILVTSAGHMPRSLGVFRKNGMNPIPAPTDYMTAPSCLVAGYLPRASHLVYSDLAVHEYLGLLWYKITGRL
jgi:uncharacterized SAM-binding protein YcdF (DUF218 family)